MDPVPPDPQDTAPQDSVPPDSGRPGPDGSGWQGSGWQRPAGHGPGQRPPDRGAIWALWLAGGALLLMFFFPPVALALAVTALVMGVRARRRSRRSGTVARGAVAGIVMGAIALTISVLLVTTQIILWGELNRYLNCREAANTISDEQECKDTFLTEVEKKLNLREGSLKKYNLPM
jgi:hypothetical protein